MSGKKWFLYLGDRQEGPFTREDIAARITAGKVSTTHYVWTEGMTDWKMMSILPEFSDVAPTKTPEPPEPPFGSGLGNKMEPTGDLERRTGSDTPIIPPPAAALELEKNMDPAVKKDKKREKEFEVLGMPPPAASGPKGSSKTSVRRILFFLLGVGAPLALIAALFTGQLDPALKSPALRPIVQNVMSIVRPWVLKGIDHYPKLGKWISPIPNVPELSEADNEELRQAATAILEEEGPKIALSLSPEDAAAPTFHVATNLPSGTEFKIFVRGNRETLLNQLEFNSELSIKVNDRLGRTEVLKDASGKAVPKGEYFLYAVESDHQPEATKKILASLKPKVAASKIAHPDWLPPNRKIVLFRSLFLGGKKDAAYQSKLKEYHDVLLGKAKEELSQLRTILNTLAPMPASLSTQFAKARAATTGKNAKKPKVQKNLQKAKADWESFFKKWEESVVLYAKASEAWTPEMTQREFFYGPLFEKAKIAIASLMKAGTLRRDFLAAPPKDQKEFDAQATAVDMETQTAITQFQTKLEEMEKLPPTPGGLPQREGL